MSYGAYDYTACHRRHNMILPGELTRRVVLFCLPIVFLVLLCRSASAGYWVCEDPVTHQQYKMCKGCLPSMNTIGYDNGPCPGGSGGGAHGTSPQAQQCIPSINLHDIGYTGGHKSRYCENHGYDGNQGWTCYRDCSTDCKKINLQDAGWISGNKAKFCQKLGYDGVHSAAGSHYSEGYCYKGEPKICANN
jgi:hypothetical protein